MPSSEMYKTLANVRPLVCQSSARCLLRLSQQFVKEKVDVSELSHAKIRLRLNGSRYNSKASLQAERKRPSEVWLQS